MNSSNSTSSSGLSEKPRKWQALNRFQRRILGVLVEKSKTTPDAYPMTVAGITTASNQKSNRSPLMTLDQDDVQTTLDQLRAIGAVMEVQGDGRVAKFRHLMNDWMGVERAELAIMTELMLRGHQSLGDLRVRASRMETISDLNQLRQLIDSLIKQGLMIELTPAGRGQIVSHNLYQLEELKKVQSQVESEKGLASDDSDNDHEVADSPAGSGSSRINMAERLEKLEEQMQTVLQRLTELEN
jgi:uncharacterized protein YceH (UPF0502 family)